jgi:hypothetical protein
MIGGDWGKRYTFSGWKNNSGEECPAFGVARVTGISSTTSGLTQVQATKPDTTFSQIYIVNGPRAVPAGNTGHYFTSREVVVLCDASAAFGEGWGPKNGQWSLAKNYPQSASIMGEHSSSKKYYRARWGEITVMRGILDATLNQGSSATVSLYGGSAGTTDTGVNVTGNDYLLKSGQSVASGKKCKVEVINGILYVTQAECA